MQEQDNNPALENHKIPDLIARFKTAFIEVLDNKSGSSIAGKIKAVLGRKTPAPLISKKNAELGLQLINGAEEQDPNETYWTTVKLVGYKTNRYNRIDELLGTEQWDDPENYNLLIYIFGEEKAACVRHAWKQVPNQIYQSGYYRRSFRSPQNREIYLVNQINFIVQLVPQVYKLNYKLSGGYDYVYYDLSLVDQVKYSHITGDTNPALFRLWSAAIDLGNDQVFKQLVDIIFNRDEAGKVTRNIIKALLNSNKEAAWDLTGKLLLAAQRQEGLRQTILEALDETSIGGLKYIIRLIIDHQLGRFSSVVRSVDVWAGLGWDSERETTVRSFLEKAILYLEQPEKIPAAIKSDNNSDIYMALWAQGVYDVEATWPYIEELLKSEQVQKRTLAVIFASQTGHYKINMPCYYAALNDPEPEPVACAANGIHQSVANADNAKHYDHYYPGLFDTLEAAYKRFPVKQKIVESFVFSWLKIQFERKTILKAMVCLVADKQERLTTVLGYFEDMDAEIRRQLSRVILPDHAGYVYETSPKSTTPLTSFQREYALLILSDRTEYEVAYKALLDEPFSTAEMEIFPDLLKRKAAGFRTKMITLLLRQTNEVLFPVLKQILLAGDPEQRLAALDIMIQLKGDNRLTDESRQWIVEFGTRKTISTKEEILFTELTKSSDAIDISAANGYGLYSPSRQSPVITPTIDPSGLYEKMFAAHHYGFSMHIDHLKKALTDLYDLYIANKDYEYEVENWDKSTQKVLLGNTIRNKTLSSEFASPEKHYNNFPLFELWDDWYQKSKLKPVDLFLISLVSPSAPGKAGEAVKTQLPGYKEMFPENIAELPTYQNPILIICNALWTKYPFTDLNEFCIGATKRLFASLSPEILQLNEQGGFFNYSQYPGWQASKILNLFLQAINIESTGPDQIRDCWNLYNWRQFSGRPEYIAASIPPLLVFCLAYEHKIINEDDLIRGILTTENIQILSRENVHKHEKDYIKQFPFLGPVIKKVSDFILDVELKRGDTATPVTPFAASLQSIRGIKRLTEILAGLGKTNLNKGYIYYWGDKNYNKQEIFSVLLKKCYPDADDTQEFFNSCMQKIKPAESRLIEVAIYAPQWQGFVSNYLGWKGLDTAIWWMHAHTKTDNYHAQTAEAESEIARYSTLDVQDFKDGAVDKEWFTKAYAELGAERWPILYNAAKYITDGNGHRRARIYADVLLGNLTLTDVTEKISSKRDQDYLRVYGLVPLHKTKTEKDILERYEFIEAFRKESKQFGSMKQSSEAAAIRVALENLARNAGYADPIRFTWAMETKQVQSIFSKETQVQYDDVLIGLVIDEDGQADVVAFKDEKQLKSIPAKLKKDKKIEELQSFKKKLREQSRRATKGLEDAMVHGDVFMLAEIETLFSHPVISKKLEKLVFVAETKDKLLAHGFYQDKKLVTPEKSEYKLLTTDNIRIAHCTDLFNTGAWASYQHFAFNKKLQQPFKQIFRELYLPTADELQEKSISRRYAGHQVQPKQTVALLKTRGWKVNYEEGLQKLYQKEGFVVRMYAMADWFSPADVENPTLETVQFHRVKNYELVHFDTIQPRIFSEVMRDLDLVVSVAHAGGVDAEASASSIEMRTVLLTETLRLFKISNVEIKGSHAIVMGKLGEYNIHLGSAVVHKAAAGYLSILPVHSQQRGRLFLPFTDDDPKSAEVISKVLLLARDNEIQDPTILRQLS